MTVWLKILLILILGGILSTLGDRLGSKVGKARLSIFKLRPKSTAVLITVFTGSIISAISFATMIVFDRDLRVGLFQLEDIREKIIDSEKELKKLEKNLYAFRSGNVVISSGQTLVTKTIKSNKNNLMDQLFAVQSNKTEHDYKSIHHGIQRAYQVPSPI